jgi:hypothetical protein
MNKLWLVLLAFALLGTSQGPLFSSNAFDNVGDNTWNNPTNAQAEDGVFATVAAAPSLSDDLMSDIYGFSIPGTATITGLQLEIKAKSSLAGTVDHTLGPVSADATVGIPVGITMGTTLAWISTGGDGQLYSFSWTPSLVNATGFGADFSTGSADNNETLSVDAFRITVFYTLPATKKNQVIGSLEHHAQTSYGGLITDKIIGEPGQ